MWIFIQYSHSRKGSFDYKSDILTLHRRCKYRPTMLCKKYETQRCGTLPSMRPCCFIFLTSFEFTMLLGSKIILKRSVNCENWIVKFELWKLNCENWIVIQSFVIYSRVQICMISTTCQINNLNIVSIHIVLSINKAQQCNFFI